MSYQKYFDEIKPLLDSIEKTQGPQIEKAAQVMTDVIANGGMVHIFGPGHTCILAQETTWRAGGLSAMSPIIDPDLVTFFGPQVGLMEQLEGYGVILFETHATEPGEAVIVVSHLGFCAVAVDVALAAKRKGLTVIAVTGVDYSRQFEPWHSSGKRLMDVADIVLDNFCPVGEALVKLEGLPQPVGPASTILAAYILDALVVQVAANLLERGITPPVRWSANVEIPFELREQLIRSTYEPYRDRIHRRQRPSEPLAQLLEVSRGYTGKPF